MAVRRHKHNLNHYKLMSGRMGELLPVKCIETLPGDTFRCQSTALLRLSPMVAPVMHPIHVRLHTFFVPNRLLWDEWEDFIVDMNTTLIPPRIADVVAEGSALDYLGVPPGDYTNNPFMALQLRAYNLIWNEFFRDQDLDAERNLDDQTLLRVRWEKDYFTTARTEPQQGPDNVVDIEFDEPVPIRGIGLNPNPAPVSNLATRETGQTEDVIYSSGVSVASDQNGANKVNVEWLGNQPNIRIAPGTVAGGFSINDWRRAMAWQRLAEHRNKYGSRYTDYLNFLGIRSSDARLQRPEYVGGGSATVSISEVLSTADTLNDVQSGANLGSLAGHGIAGHRTKPMRYFCEEHGFLMTLASVRPKTMYTQAAHKQFWRTTPADYWQKEMEIMGDQPVQNKELYALSPNPDDTFGYVDRHKDYRQYPSQVAGEMRNILDYWHLSRDFTDTPQLNTSFVSCNPTERIFADSNTDTFQLMASHKVTARRLVSKRARI